MEKYLSILELDEKATQKEIKAAYLDLAKVWHPDRFSSDARLQAKAQEKLKKINEAYEFLKGYKLETGKLSPPKRKTQKKTENKVVFDEDELFAKYKKPVAEKDIFSDVLAKPRWYAKDRWGELIFWGFVCCIIIIIWIYNIPNPSPNKKTKSKNQVSSRR